MFNFVIPPATFTNLQTREGVVLNSGDLVASEVEDAQVLQTPKHVRGDEVNEVTIEGQLQQLSLTEKGPGLQGRDAVVLQVKVMEAAQMIQVLKTDLDYSIVLQEDSL